MAQAQQYDTIKPEQVKTGMKIRVHQRITEQTAKGQKERIQVFEGLVLSTRGKGIHKTMTVRKISNGVGVEKIFPLLLPTLEKIELVKRYKVRKKNIGFLRTVKKRLREMDAKLTAPKEEAVPEEGKVEEVTEADVVPEEKTEQEGDNVGAQRAVPEEETEQPSEEQKPEEPEPEEPKDEKAE
jgi:large subunit ribosomal protein L19